MNKQYVKVFIQHKVWEDNVDTGRKAGQGILITSRESSTIRLGNLNIAVSSPSITLAGQRTSNASNEISYWLEGINTHEEFLALPTEYTSEQGCYLEVDGDLHNPTNKRIIKPSEFDAVQSPAMVFAS